MKSYNRNALTIDNIYLVQFDTDHHMGQTACRSKLDWAIGPDMAIDCSYYASVVRTD